MKTRKNNSYIKLRTQVGQFQGEDAPVKNLKKWKKEDKSKISLNLFGIIIKCALRDERNFSCRF